jgi:hypothetical protein
MWVFAGLSTVAALLTGTMAVVTANDVEDDVYVGPGDEPPPGSDLDDKINRARTLAVTTDVLITVAALSSAVAISFSIVNAVAPEEPTAALVVSPTFVGVEGRF